MTDSNQEPIAIIGTAYRFPGNSDTPSKLWELLQSPRDLLGRVPRQRFNATGYFHPDGNHHGATNVQESYFLDEDPTLFDNGFFNIQPSESEAIDPQQRLLMETVYDSLCAAGQKMEELRGSSTAVYVGMMCDDWAYLLNRDWDLLHTYTATGISRAVTSNRISYYFDWHGPSMTIDTACSSSLVAVHHAVQALRNGESQVAIAAGVNLILAPGMYIAESNLHMLSPSGRCKMWDAAADGYARGEGIASIVLKPLSKALADGDHIECVIRATGVNQDGRTAGLTMPSHVAQAALIRDTYARSRLDITDPKDRPQYFHAHGTGTQAGDPQEAQAIASAFFPDGKKNDVLHVGSVKTVIGHTEGTAGLASLISTSLAMQHGVIPPNMHFNTLSDKVAPYYKHLKITTEAVPWPAPVAGQSRRASINSFGFGGTNAHAIIESFESALVEKISTPSFTPITISAASGSSLRGMLSDLAGYLRANEETSLRDLAYTLNSRRSTLPYRKTVTCRTSQELAAKIDHLLSEQSGDLNTRYASVSKPKILGIFTGQGAQWPRMGAELVESSPLAAERLQRLDDALSSLPEKDRPDWTLREQLLAGEHQSRVLEAAISQPLCTAVQIILVDVLQLAGIKLTAVVGHSSGEIAAAYASGLLSAVDAIRVAYYRGLYAKLARSPDSDQRGAMMAVGTTLEDATDFCQLDGFEGNIQVAAHNSSSSVTLSGDEDAIAEAMAMFQQEGKFARRLKVDTAYHSRHMTSCSGAYLDALQRCAIKATTPNGDGATWLSSVVQGQAMSAETLRPSYWVDNMTNTVLFSSAIATACDIGGPFDLVLEIGPHPALKGPCLDTIQEELGAQPPYSGLLARNEPDVEKLAAALGYVWTHLGPGSVDFESVDAGLTGVSLPKRLIHDLPNYPFDHSRSYYALSRVSGMHLNVNQPPHPILGRRCVEQQTATEVRWRNMVRPNELGWLSGHRIQGQILFPATGYIAMAVEAAAILAGEKPVEMFELENLVIGRAMTFNEDNLGLETSTSLRITESSSSHMRAEFLCHSGLPYDNASTLGLNASATVSVIFGPTNADTLPYLQGDRVNLVDTDVDRFYTQLEKLGYNYGRPFTGIKSIHRKPGFAKGQFEDESGHDWEDNLIVHPSWLDTAVQTGLAAYSSPQDERLWTLHVPTAVKSIKINPHFTKLGRGQTRQLSYQAVMDESQQNMTADIDVVVSENDSRFQFVQFESIELKPFAGATADSDACLFSQFEYKMAEPHGTDAVSTDNPIPPDQEQVIRATERMGFYYMRRLLEEITPEQEAATLPHFRRLLSWSRHVLSRVEAGEHPTVPPDAVNDTHDSIKALIAKHGSAVDIVVTAAVGENVIHAVRTNGSTLEYLLRDGELDRFYEEAVGLNTSNIWIGRMLSQIAHRYPHLNILEVGAGTGGATRCLLPELGVAFSSYTYTDVSAGFFERAQERFEQYSDRMLYKTFDMERSPAEQGFREGSYDIVIASNVLHATGKLEEVMGNVRRLLKPGGYLLSLEIQSNECLGVGLIMGSLPGWWAGAERDARRSLGPALTLSRWDSLLAETGFSGVDTATPSLHQLHAYSVFCAQAVDGRISSLRNPLVLPAPIVTSSLAIVGGETIQVDQLSQRIARLLKSRYAKVDRFRSLEDLHDAGMENLSSVISLTELDKQFFETRTPKKLESLRNLWRRGGSILWVTRGVLDDSPYSSMLLGMSRTIRYEYSNLTLQMLDLDAVTPHTAQLLAEALIRIELLGSWKDEPRADGEFMYSLEPELVVRDNRLLIPRAYPHKQANSRYNTYRRTVHEEVETDESAVMLVPNGDSYSLCGVSPLCLEWRRWSERVRTLKVLKSLLQTIQIPGAGFFTLSSGIDEATGEHCIALSESIQSIITTPAAWALATPCPVSPGDLVQVAAYLVARGILDRASNGGTILVNDSDIILGDVLVKETRKLGIRVQFTSSIKDSPIRTSAYIPPNLPARHVKQMIPRDTTLFVNFGATTTGDLISKSLPQHVPVASALEFMGANSTIFPGISSSNVRQSLRDACENCRSALLPVEKVSTIPLAKVNSYSVLGEPLTVVDWDAKCVKVALQSIDSAQIFRGDGTYFLVGLSGELGQSLCHWMVTHGARNVVLTSRNPKVDPEYVQMIERLGGTLKVMSMDVTDRTSLHTTYEEIRNTMPPVIGVANGAMILEDELFDNLTFEGFDRSVAPKVDGSRHLDELFHTTELDFFIFLSSLSNVIGNSGQSSYVAANQFMVALAAQRKKRGVPGSAMAISPMQGIGYVARSHFDSDHFSRFGYRNISEQDYLQLFAESIRAGRPENPDSHEVITGLSPVHDDAGIQRQLREDPKFGHFVLKRREAQIVSVISRDSRCVPMRVRLAEAKTREGVEALIQDAFNERLRRILMLGPGEAINERISLVDQGVDSIVAVEIRTWFLRELDVDIPVVKILSASSTITELLTDIMTRLPNTILQLDSTLAQGSQGSQGQTAGSLAIHDPVAQLVLAARPETADSSSQIPSDSSASYHTGMSTPVDDDSRSEKGASPGGVLISGIEE